MIKKTWMRPFNVLTTALLLIGAAYANAQEPVTVFLAKNIYTMEERNPEAQAVAVSNNRIVSVGTVDSVKAALGQQSYKIDETFKNKVIMPGFIEQHIHPMMTALTLTTDVVSMEDWDLPHQQFKAAKTPAEYKQRLMQINAEKGNSEEWLYSWGYHPLWHGQINREYLDKISSTRPIIIWDRSCHDFYLNTAAIKALKLDKKAMEGHGLASTQVDWEKGHWFENGAIELLAPKLLTYFATPERLTAGTQMMADHLQMKGVTAFADPGVLLVPGYWKILQDTLGKKEVPLTGYFFPETRTSAVSGMTLEQGMAETQKLVALGTEGKVAMLPKHIKFFADGAIISQAMQMKDGYLDGHDGQWMMTPELLDTWSKMYWDAGYQLHIHVTGDLGLETVLNMLEKRMAENPRPDHRTVLVHFPVADEAQIDRIARVGAIVSTNPYYPIAFANKFAQYGLGPKRAHALAPNGFVLKHSIPLSFHSDMPVASADPLFLAWSAVNRKTIEGNVVAPEQQISVHDAMRAITIESAYSWGKEKELGSIAPGKIANFTVLEANPYTVKPIELKNIPIWGTVYEGKVFENPAKTVLSSAALPHAVIEDEERVSVLAHDHSHAKGDICEVSHKMAVLIQDQWNRKEQAKNMLSHKNS
ncbi:amidohydrolase [Acinetobacter pullicarnis]|uniref:amidohydrolase n=1 Tax=Acinetobacter pullicarnis TaxID=2576829 RepID=UPI00111DFAAE|nr:amidohydrolase [Acinetobacter pullicarnis]